MNEVQSTAPARRDFLRIIRTPRTTRIGCRHTCRWRHSGAPDTCRTPAFPIVQEDDDCDLVVHAGATEQGLARALELLRPEGAVVELSCYGDRRGTLPVGEAFHSRRLSIRGSRVGTVSPARADRT